MGLQLRLSALSLLLLAGCASTGELVSESRLPTALSSHVKLASEPPLDRDGGRVFVFRAQGTIRDQVQAPDGLKPWRLVLETGPDTFQTLFLTLAPGISLPEQVGDHLEVAYFAKWDAAAGVGRRGLVLRRAPDDPVLIFQDSDVVPKAELAGGLAVLAGKGRVYTEASRKRRLCYTVVEHRELRLSERLDGGLPPGTLQEVTTRHRRWMVGLVDHAVTLVDRSQCPQYRPDRFAWFAVRLADPVERPDADSEPAPDL